MNARGVEVGEVGGGGAAGEKEVGGERGEGGEDEGSLEHARVRERQTVVVEAKVAEEEDVKIEGARAPTFAADAAMLLFDGETEIEKGVRRKGGVDTRDGVEKSVLTGGADGSGLENGGDGVEADVG